MSWDVAIVGGGPSGLAVAIAAAERGLSVIVCDARRPPIDKACGEGLMPDAVEWLRRWGIEIAPTDRFAIRGIRYLDGEHVAEAAFSGASGWGVRRTVLQPALVRRAAEAGAELRWEVRVRGIDGRTLETERGPIAAEWIVGADGLHSRVRQWTALGDAKHPATDRGAHREIARRRHGVRRHYRVEPWSDHVEVYWADGAEAYVTPVGAAEVGVALLWSGRGCGFDEMLTPFPALAAHLAGRPASSRDRGAAELEQPARRVTSGCVALVGDAAGYVDAITGEGLAAAFHQADALADALAAGRLDRYARAHRRLSRIPVALIRTLLFVERHPRLRRRLIAALASDPEILRRLLAVHAGQARLGGLPSGTLLRLATALAKG